MEKQDILVVAIAIIAITVLALVITPIISGQSAGIPGGGTANPKVTTTVPRTPGPSRTTPQPTTPVPATTPTPTQTPWNGQVKNVGFIGQPDSQTTLPPTPPIPEEPTRNRTLVTYAKISGSWSGTTENLYVPTPYWVMEYTAEPFALPPNAFPQIIIQVIDVENPNQVVISPIRQTIYEQPPDEPWSVKIFEGKRTYYFRIDTSFIKSYTITIKVPREYL